MDTFLEVAGFFACGASLVGLVGGVFWVVRETLDNGSHIGSLRSYRDAQRDDIGNLKWRIAALESAPKHPGKKATR